MALDPDSERVVESQGITIDKIKRLLPKKTNIRVTEKLLENIKNIEKDTDLDQNIMEEKFMSYIHVMEKVRGISLQDYLNAVKYVSLCKHFDNKKAWSIVFPTKYDKLVTEGRFIDSHVSEFNTSTLVVELQAAFMVPWHLEFDRVRRDMLSKSIHMANGVSPNGIKVSPHVALKAMELVLNVLAPPEESKLEITLGSSEGMVEQQRQMNDNLAKLIANQSAQFRAGGDVGKIQKLHVVQHGEEEDVVDVEYE